MCRVTESRPPKKSISTPAHLVVTTAKRAQRKGASTRTVECEELWRVAEIAVEFVAIVLQYMLDVRDSEFPAQQVNIRMNAI